MEKNWGDTPSATLNIYDISRNSISVFDMNDKKKNA